MSGAKRAAVIALLVVVAAVCVWRLVGTLADDRPPRPVLGWKCSACGEVFEAIATGPDGEAVSDVATVPAATCPKCGGVARRLVRFRCTACSHEFDFLMGPAREGAQGSQPRCPKCRDRRVAPVQALEKR